MKNSSDTIGNRTRDPTASSAELLLPPIVGFYLRTPCGVTASRREYKKVTESVGRRPDKSQYSTFETGVCSSTELCYIVFVRTIFFTRL